MQTAAEVKIKKIASHALRSDLIHEALPFRALAWRIISMRPGVRLFILALALVSALCGVLGPYFQKRFVDSLLAQETHSLATWITGAFFMLLASQAFAAFCKVWCAREGAIVNRWLSRGIYAHILRLSSSSRSKHTVGELVNLYAQDVNATVALLDELLPMVATSIIPFIIAPIAVSLYFDLPLLPIACVALSSLAILLTMSARQSRYFSAFKTLASERLAVVNEWLQNIRIIRILGWTEAMEGRIFKKREAETANRLAMVTNGSAMNAIAQAAPGILSATAIASIVVSERNVTPGDVFALLWVLSVFLARPIRSVPWNVVILLDGLTSGRRLEKLIALATEDDADHSDRKKTPPNECALAVKGLSVSIGGTTLLNEVNFSLKPGEFVAIVGEIGAGKSLLLDALLRESGSSFENYTIAGEDALSMDLGALRSLFALVPQDGFVMSASLRDNVAFEYDAPLAHDDAVAGALRLASFDLSQETITVDTELGERGVNLSGGQRQRVSLGRAYFNERPFVLLDDCLSAVDVDTEQRLLSELIEGAWRDKTRLLVTHRLSVLPRVDRILVMKKGKIVAEGTYDELMKTSEHLLQLSAGGSGEH